MSLSRLRLLATSLPLAGALVIAAAGRGFAAPADTWHLLTQQPAGVAGQPVQALTVDPTTVTRVLYGTGAGEIYRSSDGGASFSRVAAGLGRGVVTLAFDPIEPTHVLAGTTGAGIWRSEDSGGTWHSLDHGTETVRAFDFSLGLSAAGTDTGVLITTDGDTWTSAGLKEAAISAIAVGGGKIFAGSDSDPSVQGLAAFRSGDGGKTWAKMPPPASSGAFVGSLALKTDRLLLGTNTGLFASGDSGATWTALSNGGSLPATDFTAILPIRSRVYVASDGGAGSSGGLWATDDGQSFRSLNSPLGSVTAIAANASTIYVATYRPVDHAAQLWSYVDDGGAPQAPDTPLASPAAYHAPSVSKPPPLSADWLKALASGPEAPYLALGIGAVLILLLALIAYLRRRA